MLAKILMCASLICWAIGFILMITSDMPGLAMPYGKILVFVACAVVFFRAATMKARN